MNPDKPPTAAEFFAQMQETQKKLQSTKEKSQQAAFKEIVEVLETAIPGWNAPLKRNLQDILEQIWEKGYHKGMFDMSRLMGEQLGILASDTAPEQFATFKPENN